MCIASATGKSSNHQEIKQSSRNQAIIKKSSNQVVHKKNNQASTVLID